jgi:hypothetical protein
MFGVVGYHAAAKEKAMPRGFAEEPDATAAREILIGKPQGIADGCAEQ